MEQSERLNVLGLIALAVIVGLTIQRVNEPVVTAELDSVGYHEGNTIVQVLVREQNWWKSSITSRDRFVLLPGDTLWHQSYGGVGWCGVPRRPVRVWLTHEGDKGVCHVKVEREGKVVFDDWFAVPDVRAEGLPDPLDGTSVEGEPLGI